MGKQVSTWNIDIYPLLHRDSAIELIERIMALISLFYLKNIIFFMAVNDEVDRLGYSSEDDDVKILRFSQSQETIGAN